MAILPIYSGFSGEGIIMAEIYSADSFKLFGLNPALDSEISYIHKFRVVTDKKSPNFGKTREPVEISFSIPKFDELPARETLILIQFAIREMVLRFFKEAGNDWNFIPSAEDLEIKNLAGILQSARKSGERLWKAENLRIFFSEFSEVFQRAGKSQGFIQTLEKLAELKFLPLSGKTEKISSVLNFLSSDSVLLDYLDSAEFQESENAGICAGILSVMIEILESLQYSGIDLDSLDSMD